MLSFEGEKKTNNFDSNFSTDFVVVVREFVVDGLVVVVLTLNDCLKSRRANLQMLAENLRLSAETCDC